MNEDKLQLKPVDDKKDNSVEITEWKNPKWWSAITSQIISMLALFGIFTSEQAKAIDNSTATIIGATFIVVANLYFIHSVIKAKKQV